MLNTKWALYFLTKKSYGSSTLVYNGKLQKTKKNLDGLDFSIAQV